MSAQLPRAAVIGAGSSGITALKTLVELPVAPLASTDAEPAAA